MAISFDTTSSTTSGIWYTWCSNSSTTTATTTDNNIIWATWAGSSSYATSSTTTTNVWTIWTSGTNVIVPAVIRQETEEERLAREERQRIEREKREREQEERKRKEAEANQKADDLLKSFLTPEQVKQLDELSCFIVTTPKGHTYRIKREWSGNVERLNEEQKPVERMCIVPGVHVPRGDQMLAQLLMLETDEEQFLKIANRTPIRAGVN